MRAAASVFLLLVLGLSYACAKSSATRAQADAEVKPAPMADLTLPPDAERSASGLASKVLKAGSGEQRPALQDEVRLDFTAWNAKGEVADGSEKRGGPVTFAVTGVIAGWTEALQQMRVGEQRRLWIPDHLVYPGRPGPPRPTAVFDLTLREIIPGRAPPAPDDVAAVPVDATKTPSGLAFKFLARAGSSEKPHAWDRVAINYAGWTSDGTLVESSRRERPSIFDVGNMMPGLREALPLLSVGDRVRLWLPEALAYQGRVGEPQGAVVFEVELVSIERRPEPPRAPAQLTAAPRDATKTKSGLAYRMLKKGDGKIKPKANDRVELHYSAWTRDGALFDSSVLRGNPVSVPVNRLIPGWAEGLQLMVEGDKALFWIPEELAYKGNAGSPQGMLVYEVELLKIAP